MPGDYIRLLGYQAVMFHVWMIGTAVLCWLVGLYYINRNFNVVDRIVGGAAIVAGLILFLGSGLKAMGL